MSSVTSHPRLCAAFALAVLSPFCFDSCYVTARGSALRGPIPAPVAGRPPRAVSISGPAGRDDALAEALQRTGLVVVVAFGTPGSLHILAELSRHEQLNPTAWLHWGSLGLLPGFCIEVWQLDGVVELTDGTQRQFALRREDLLTYQMLLVLPGLLTNSESRASQLGDFPQALVAWLADEGLL